jgi:TonB family protein
MMNPIKHLITTFAAVITCWSVRPLNAGERETALYAPMPTYPALPNGMLARANGIFVLHVDGRKGIVTSVSIKKTTGYPNLDHAAIDAFIRWRFKPGRVPPEVTVPISFTNRPPSSR